MSSISLEKGGNVNLDKVAPGLKKIVVGLGWDVNVLEGDSFDLDASMFILGANDKVRNESDFIFYNNKDSADGSIHHHGDNLTGDGDGDDEVIDVNLEQLPIEVQKIAVVVSIHKAEERHQNFGQVNHAFMRIVNGDDNVEISRYDLTEDASTATSMIFGEIYRHDGNWKFRAVGSTKTGGLKAIAEGYGIQF